MVQEPAIEVFTPFLTKGLITQKHCWQYADLKKFCQLGHNVGLQCPVPSLNAPKGPSCYRKSIMFQLQICCQSHRDVSWKTKANINFKGQNWVRPPCKVLGLFYPISIMPQISIKDSGILQLTKNAKTDNNIAGYHVFSCRVISTYSDVQHLDLSITYKICIYFRHIVITT